MKKTSYFSHDANAMDDIKILNMRADYGIAGYGLFWAIVEQLRVEDNYSLPLNKNTYRAIKIKTNADVDIEQYIMDCINEYGLFKITDDGKYFYSCSLKRRMEMKDEKKNRRSEAGKKGAEKRWKNDNAINNDSNAIENDGNATNIDGKKWQKKRKEKKVKESKVNTITKLNETFNYILNNNTGEMQNFHNMLQRIDMDVQQSYYEQSYYMSKEDDARMRLIAVCLYILYNSSYKVYLNKISREKVINKYYKAENYIGTWETVSDGKVEEFVSYFCKSLMNDFDTKT